MQTIRSSREIERTFDTGRRAAHPLLVVVTSESHDPERLGRVAFIAGKKLGPAVLRNRSKRVLREASRRLGAPWSGRDTIIIARAGIGDEASESVEAALRDTLKRAGVTIT